MCRYAFLRAWSRGGSLLLAISALLSLLLAPTAAQAETPARHWIDAWAAAPQASTIPISNMTLRNIVHANYSGSTIRLRLSNTYGNGPVTFGAVSIGVPSSGPISPVTLPSPGTTTTNELPASIAPGTLTPAYFSGSRSVTVPPGGSIVTDPISFAVTAGQSYTVSVYVSNAVIGTFHAVAVTTNYYSPAGSGNFADDPTGSAYGSTTPNWWFLTSVETLAAPDTGTVVAFGDSITDGYQSSSDQNHRYPDYLVSRLASAGIKNVAVVDEGIGANLLTRDGIGDAGVKRIERDAFDQQGVRALILLEGINDINSGVPADTIISGYKSVVIRAHALGLRVFGGTLTPTAGCVNDMQGYQCVNTNETTRQTVNDFIRHSGLFDGVVDFDAAVRLNPALDVFNPIYNSGDNLHPSDMGYQAMAGAVDLPGLEAASSGPGASTTKRHLARTKPSHGSATGLREREVQ